MPPKRRPDKPTKIVPISPHRIRPTLTSPPPMKSRRGRAPKGARPIAKASQRKRPKVDAKDNRFYTAKRILDENKTDYLIEWDGINPETKKPYMPTWHPKSCANRALLAEWKKEKGGQEWAAQGIVHENQYYYKIAWEDNPKTGEVYPDSWEPKAFASEAMVKNWEQRKLEMRARDKTSTGNDAAASDDESLASNDDVDAESEKEHRSDEDALQQQIAREVQTSPSRSNEKSP
ncbi:chromo domain-like protein [Diplodia corticola]|uniref:Chromo domain-like protein n=1 Tax=Diplodia corticola TaxID=236234 RepID=A0A1J9REA5_9PEZI|nr:chromo domain-like protein [Diplodia corticola]OJD39846.1 chromo domain-like protein [Diplodia corticola]